jgi:hypothetical protein
MTAAVILAELEQLDRDRAALMEQLRAALAGNIAAVADSAPAVSTPTAAGKQPIAKRRWELAAKAFRRFPFEPHTVRRICSAHPEWAVKFTGGVWYVDADMFAEYAARVERGEASFAVSALSAKSVAPGAQSMFSHAGSISEGE